MVVDIREHTVTATCSACGQVYSARDAAWVENALAKHPCPPPEAVENALKGRYDG